MRGLDGPCLSQIIKGVSAVSEVSQVRWYMFSEVISSRIVVAGGSGCGCLKVDERAVIPTLYTFFF